MPSPGKLTRLIVSAILSSLIALPAALASPVAKQIEAIYQPLRVERAALAPDGGHVAFAVRDHDGLHAIVCGVDNPDSVTRQLLDSRADVHLQFLDWAGPDHLIAGTDASQVFLIGAGNHEPTLLADAVSFGATEKENTSVMIRVAGVSDDNSSVTIEVIRFVSPSQIVLEAVRVDLPTGLKSILHTSRLDPPGGEILTDRQGRPRVLYDRGASPQSFDFLPSSETEVKNPVWKPLNRLPAGFPPRNFQVTPQTFLGERSFPLGFDYHADLLYYASNIGRDTYGIYSLDLTSGRSATIGESSGMDLADIHRPLSDSVLIFDRALRTLAGIRPATPTADTRWFDGELAGVQEELEGIFTKRKIQVLGWDNSRRRFLLLITSPSDPGRYFVYHRSEARCVEYYHQTLLDADELNPTETFVVGAEAGVQVSGCLTRPHITPSRPPALVIWFHDGPWQQIDPGFQADAQALAAMGFMVAQIDYRGSTGHGRQHTLAIQRGFDLVPLSDALATVALLVGKYGADPNRVAAAGEGFGGFLALRAVQLHPEAFRCAIALDAPLDLHWPGRLVQSEGTQMRAAKLHGMVRNRPPLSFLGNSITAAYDGSFERDFASFFFHPAGRQNIAVDARLELFTRPVLLFNDPLNPASPIERLRKLRREITRRKQSTAQLSELPPLFLRDLSIARAGVFTEIGEFLQTKLKGPTPAAIPGQSK
jgi:acetyl esterase/lipase